MTTLLNFVAPEGIDQVDWKELASQVKMVRSLSQEKREEYFDGVVERLPPSAALVFGAYMDLVPGFFECRDFHRVSGLDYADPKNENGQIIRVALAAVLEARFKR
jgi:hypothetical protein